MKEEEKLKEVMESLKEETSGLQQDKEVRICLPLDVFFFILAGELHIFSTISPFLPLSRLSQAREKELMELSKAVNETRSRMDLAQSELDIYLSRHNTAVTQLSTARQTLQTTTDTLRERREAIKELQVKVPQNEQELKKVKLPLMISLAV